MHNDLPSAKFAVDFGVDFGGLVQSEAVAMRRVADHDVAARSAELVGQALHLVHAVQFVIHRHHQCQNRAERLEHNGGFNFDEVIEKQLAGRRAAIHNNEVRPLQRTENAVNLAPVCQIQELGVRVKPLQSRTLVVAINGDVSDVPVFEILNEVDGEEAFAHTALAVEDKVEPFHVLGGLAIRTCAMRGPRVRPGGATSPTGFVGSSADALMPLAGVESEAVFSPFPWTEPGVRFRPGRRRGRTTSPSTS